MSARIRTTALRRQARVAMTASVVAIALAACGDAADITAPARYAMPPSTPTAHRAAMDVTVDLETGTMTVESISPSQTSGSTAGISAAIYGNQGVTVRLYNGPVVIGSSPTAGKKRYSTMVGVRNLLAHSIGDEQSSSAPADIIGIDVFMVDEPAVTMTSSTCVTACTVTMVDHHGVRSFTKPNQKFWHWNEILGPAGSSTDTTRTRTSFTFEADTQVTNFRFMVVLNAPWPAPFETRYKVEYSADALPTAGNSSIWRASVTGDAVVSTALGELTIDAKNGAANYFRLDSVGPSQSAYMEARIRWNGITQNLTEAEPRFTIVDGTKFISLGIFPNGAGFINSSGVLVGTKYATVPTVYLTYRLQKYAADSVVFFVDGVRGGKLAYASLPASPYGTATRLEFGAINSKRLTSSTWDYVLYEIGVATP